LEGASNTFSLCRNKSQHAGKEKAILTAELSKAWSRSGSTTCWRTPCHRIPCLGEPYTAYKVLFALVSSVTVRAARTRLSRHTTSNGPALWRPSPFVNVQCLINMPYLGNYTTPWFLNSRNFFRLDSRSSARFSELAARSRLSWQWRLVSGQVLVFSRFVAASHRASRSPAAISSVHYPQTGGRSGEPTPLARLTVYPAALD
jgi:hypothetical protein